MFDDVTDNWNRVVGINPLGVIWGIKAFVPPMLEGDQAATVLDGLQRGRFFIRAGREEAKAVYGGRITEEFFEWNERIVRGRAEAQLNDGTRDAYLW